MRVIKNIINTVHKKNAFTLGETLVAVLILTMVSSVVAAGMPAAKNAYERVVVSSNAELLLSTTISTIRNELGLSRNVTVEGSSITYYNISNKTTSKIYLDDSNQIIYQRYAKSDMSKESSTSERLIDEALSTKNGLDVSYSSITGPTDNVVTINGLKVKHGEQVITKLDNVSIRILS